MGAYRVLRGNVTATLKVAVPSAARPLPSSRTTQAARNKRSHTQHKHTRNPHLTLFHLETQYTPRKKLERFLPPPLEYKQIPSTYHLYATHPSLALPIPLHVSPPHPAGRPLPLRPTPSNVGSRDLGTARAANTVINTHSMPRGRGERVGGGVVFKCEEHKGFLLLTKCKLQRRSSELLPCGRAGSSGKGCDENKRQHTNTLLIWNTTASL